jgi:protein-L-isoaspartate(D-aspartate) O-methyltransferase
VLGGLAAAALLALPSGCAVSRSDANPGDPPAAEAPEGAPEAPAPEAPPDPFTAEREAMVRQQIEARGVRDARVLAALRRVPRHEFVPEALRGSAYEDRPLPIGEGQTISQPYIVAIMSALLQLDGSERVLEIGTGSGYQAAVLSELAREVYTIEIVEPLAQRAARDLARLGYTNVAVKAGDGYRGWPEFAPFDAVIVTAAPDHVPQPLVDQLAVGGRMVIPVGSWAQELLLITRDERGIHEERMLGVRFVPMTGEARDGAPD